MAKSCLSLDAASNWATQRFLTEPWHKLVNVVIEVKRILFSKKFRNNYCKRKMEWYHFHFKAISNLKYNPLIYSLCVQIFPPLLLKCWLFRMPLVVLDLESTVNPQPAYLWWRSTERQPSPTERKQGLFHSLSSKSKKTDCC